MKKIILAIAVIFLLAVVIFKNVLPAQAAGNKNGVAVSQYYSEKGFTDHDKWKGHLDWAKNLVGVGGYVKLFFPWIGDADAPVDTYRQVVQEVYSRDLTPIVRVQGTWLKVPGKNGELNGCWLRPPQDGGTAYSTTAGKYGEYAQKIVDFVDTLPPPPQGKNLYIELWNEMNLDYIEWCDPNGSSAVEPENYARFYLEIYNRLQRLGKPNIKLTNGGLVRGEGVTPYVKKFLSELYDTVGKNSSTLQSLVEYFSIHVYPPTETEERFLNGVNEYENQLRIFSDFGIDPSSVKVLVTEAGYVRRSEVPSEQDGKQAKLNVELAKKLSQDNRIVAFNFFSLDDYTDKNISGGQSLLDTTLFVPSSSINVNGTPSVSRPVYQDLKAYMNPGQPDVSNTTRPVGYVVSEDGSAINSITSPVVYISSYPVTIDYKLKDLTPGTKVLYAKYFYSNGETKIAQTSFYYQPKQEQAKICTPRQTVVLCKNTQCSPNQEVANPQDVLGVQIASSCSPGQTYYSCSDIKCPDGSVAPGGGCYPDNYTSDCLANCSNSTSSSPAAPSAPVAAPAPVASGTCADECYSDELRIAVGRNSSGVCDSGYQSSSYTCRAGSVGQRRVCGSTEYVCADGNSSGFYWSQLGGVVSAPAQVSTRTPTPSVGTSTLPQIFVTNFRCNDQGTAWICTGAAASQDCPY